MYASTFLVYRGGQETNVGVLCSTIELTRPLAVEFAG